MLISRCFGFFPGTLVKLVKPPSLAFPGILQRWSEGAYDDDPILVAQQGHLLGRGFFIVFRDVNWGYINIYHEHVAIKDGECRIFSRGISWYIHWVPKWILSSGVIKRGSMEIPARYLRSSGSGKIMYK